MTQDKKVAIVTGAAKGIGKAIATELAQKGAWVVVNFSSSVDEATDVVKAIKNKGGESMAIRADVSIFSEVESMVHETIERFGRIDILVNNAGIQKAAAFADTTEEIWEETMDTNLKGVFHCIKAVLPQMKKQKSGKIINISSVAAFAGSLVSLPYGVSKAGVVNITRALRQELGENNITINSVAPGPVRTDLLEDLGEDFIDSLVKQTPLGRLATTESIAKAVSFFASDDADFITGQTLVVDGGRL